MSRTVTKKFNESKGRCGQRQIKPVSLEKTAQLGKLPRITKLMALAIRFEKLLEDGVVNDQAEIARLGHVSRARVTQIMNLLNLVPEIQEEILFLPRVERGKDPVLMRDLLQLASELSWERQVDSRDTIGWTYGSIN